MDLKVDDFLICTYNYDYRLLCHTQALNRATRVDSFVAFC